jgi:hypothetical protein
MTEAARLATSSHVGQQLDLPGAIAETDADQGWVTEGLYPCHLLRVLEESALSAVESTYRIEFQEWYRPQAFEMFGRGPPVFGLGPTSRGKEAASLSACSFRGRRRRF